MSDQKSESGRSATEHAKRAEHAGAEEVSRVSEETYRSLFRAMDEGFCVVEAVVDDRDEHVDFRFVETNDAFERHTGLASAVGKSVGEMVLGNDRHWLGTYSGLVATGEPRRFIEESKVLGRCFEVCAVRVGPAEARRVALTLKDTTEHRRRETNAAFLDAITKDLAGLANIDETMRVLGEKVGRHFDASMCLLVETDEAAGTVTCVNEWRRADVPGVLGAYRSEDHHTEEYYRAGNAGETYVVRDAMADARVKAGTAAIGIHAYVSVPLVRDGKWRFNLAVCDAVARDWRDDEVALLRELTSRIWSRLERARAEAALRDSEERQAFLLDLSDALRPIADPFEVQRVAMAALGRHLGVNRALYFDIQSDGDTVRTGPAYLDGVAALPPLLRMSDFGAVAAQYRRGETTIAHDVLANPLLGPTPADAFAAIEVRAAVGVPLVKKGRVLSVIGVHQAKVRTWTAADVELIEAVAERTWEAVERARAEASLRESRHALDREAAALARLHEASTRLWQSADLRSGLEEMLGEAISLLGADMGNVQLLNPTTRTLAIVAHRGFRRDFLEYFREVSAEHDSACGRSLRTGKRILIEDVDVEASFASLRGVARSAGYRAVLSMPLLGLTGEPLGMLSVHFRRPHKPSDPELQRLELYLRQAVEFVERQRIKIALRKIETRQSFLLKLADTLRPLADTAEIEREATRMLGEALDASRVFYAGIEADGDTGVIRSEHVKGIPSGVGRYSISGVVPELVPEWTAGRTTITADVDLDDRFSDAARAAYASLSARSALAVPLVKVGRLVALLGVSDSTPRAWTEEEVALAEETAERTWATIERARAEEALRHSETRLQLALDAAEMGTYAWYPQEDRAECDARTLALYGLAPSARLNNARLLGELIVPEDQASHADAAARALDPDGDGVLRNDFRIRRTGDGAVRWISNFGQTQFGGAPPVALAVTGVCADITERKRAEEALRQSTERLRRMVDVPGVGVVTFDHAGVLVDANAAFLAMLGYDREDFIDRRLGWRDFTPVEYMDASQREFARLLDRGVSGPYEKEYFRRDGSRIWLMFVGADLGDGTVVEYALDIRDRKRSEELLRVSEQRARALLVEATAARLQAEAANRANDEFLATLSHELRTPLAAILLWARALRSGAVPASEVSRAADAIAHSADTQSRLVEDLLDLSRLTSGKLVLSTLPTDVATVVREAAEMVSPMMTAKKLAFDVDLDEGVGVAMLDRGRLQQILGNLLANAVKFTPEGGAVTFRVRKGDADLELEVADTGEGISPELLPRIFERFWQADMAETRRHMGLGIGLALTKQLVELHGGTIEGRSDGPGRGAVFRVRLPWVPANESDARRRRAAVGPVSSAQLEGVTVLLVEDDPSTREAMQWTLERAGATVVPAATAAAAFSAFDTASVDVVVSDLGLAGVSGLVLIERIAAECRRRGSRPPPSCAVSAHARDVDRQRAIDAGFDMYLAKPITGERLIEAVVDLRDVLRSDSERV